MFPIAIFANAWSFITGTFKGNKVATTAILVALLLGWMQVEQCKAKQSLKRQLAVAEQNIKAANDTIRVVKDKAGKDEFDKLSFITDKLSSLEKLNADLAAEVKTIKGKVSTIIKTDVQIVHDTVPLVVTGTLRDSILTNNFDYSKTFSPANFRKFKGYTKYDLRNGQSTGEVTNDEIGIRFKTGIKNLDKGKPEIFISSDYPGFTVTALDGAVLDPTLFSKKPKVKLITTGLNIGWTPTTYDFGTKRFDYNPKRVGVTLGLNINILKLLKPR